jgi:hypothetical protein
MWRKGKEFTAERLGADGLKAHRGARCHLIEMIEGFGGLVDAGRTSGQRPYMKKNRSFEETFGRELTSISARPLAG